ncbi:Acetylornithine deacetylase/Succinyl-diaminopimelate desuccinylase [Arthrobacter sp. cf158]|uniref:M20 family metallopeptidase n=1 Tax=Arthrobacter sp. cf158 TaxID=1761744 RepID=UPI0008965F48|nr:M20 family metallopeptidase [Arthrobacter sp. cf158]SDW11437.1 Acetylornithine deacetylase/Succinyl-diaminopimelate desuccinylase [Arthrobacter sp. cf158]
MNLRNEILAAADEHVTSGAFLNGLRTAVSYPSESGKPEGRDALNAYLEEILTQSLQDMGCRVDRWDRWDGSDNSFLLGTRVEDPGLPTVLCYGHADVVDGHEGRWAAGRSPWEVSVDGGHWYGRGTADNKGQHLVNLAALRLLLAHQGKLGFNLKFLFECGEEIGSPKLAEFAAAQQGLLSADVFIASDGPRLNAHTPTIFLGARGGASFELTAALRPSSYHSGNWGGLIRNPATTLAAAIGTLVDGHGRIQLPGLLPESLPDSVRRALADVRIVPGREDPPVDEGWGDASLSPAERVYGWNTLEVLALGAADVDNPVNAIPGTARAILQLRFVTGTDTNNLESRLQDHLDAMGFGMVTARLTTVFPASRLDPDNPWVAWASNSIAETTGTAPAILPNIGGSLPNHVFEDILGLPTLWVPHSYPGCLQHAPNEHMLESIAREGLKIACGLFHDLGRAQVPVPAHTLTAAHA